MAFRYSNCIEKGLLRKIPPSPQKAEMSIVKAEKWSNEAEKSLNGKALDASIMASYLVMFHSARAILYYDGYREKSHACVARYLEEKYMKPGRRYTGILGRRLYLLLATMIMCISGKTALLYP